ncbi:Mitochondrial inner membrane protease atp23 [Arthrobotrys conoides]|uniref:Mitochondrial inner membrane protease ATP23 n=1 Tax=Arthrobotrys conoides TaxID=74498 RepID=A0AAN8NIR7_9PEZI
MSDDTSPKVEGTASLDHESSVSDSKPVYKGKPMGFFRHMSAITGYGMTPESIEEYRRDFDDYYAETLCKRCEENRDWLIQYSPIVRFMMDQIREVNGNLSSENIKCLPCNKDQAGGFHPKYGILLCQNKLRDRSHTEDTMAHEMVHAYDHMRFKVDWADFKHLACSEIRASTLSGECRPYQEWMVRGQWKFLRHMEACVRRRATLSVSGHPALKGDLEAAGKIVDQVFESCYKDTRPFREVYK